MTKETEASVASPSHPRTTRVCNRSVDQDPSFTHHFSCILYFLSPLVFEGYESERERERGGETPLGKLDSPRCGQLFFSCVCVMAPSERERERESVGPRRADVDVMAFTSTHNSRAFSSGSRGSVVFLVVVVVVARSFARPLCSHSQVQFFSTDKVARREREMAKDTFPQPLLLPHVV